MKTKNLDNIFPPQFADPLIYVCLRLPMAALGIGVVALFQAHAASIVWTNAGDGNWNVAANWNPKQVPGPGDHAFISNFTVFVTSGTTVNSLTLSGGTLSGTNTLTVSNVLNWTGGGMSGGGRTVIAPGATLNLVNTNAVGLWEWTLENGGTVIWTGTGDLSCGSAVLTNRPGALWEVRNERGFYYAGGGPLPQFDNAGTFRKSQGSGTNIFFGFPFNNYGAVEVQSGALLYSGSGFNHSGTVSVAAGAGLRLRCGGTATGAFALAGGAWLDWTDDTGLGYLLNPGAQLNGEGLYKVSRGILSVNSAVAVQNLDLVDSLGGTNTLTVSNVLNWTGGGMFGGGRTVIAPGATLNLANTNAVGCR